MGQKNANKHIDSPECPCADCQMRNDAYFHLHDTIQGIELLYAERYDVDPGDVHGVVVQVLVKLLADAVMEPCAGMPDEQHTVKMILTDLRDQMQEVKERVIDEASEGLDAAEVN